MSLQGSYRLCKFNGCQVRAKDVLHQSERQQITFNILTFYRLFPQMFMSPYSPFSRDNYQLTIMTSKSNVLQKPIFFGSSGFSVGNRAQACWGWRSKPPQKK